MHDVEVSGSASANARQIKKDRGLRRRIGLIGALALVAGFALPAAGAQAAAPSIINTGTGCAGQRLARVLRLPGRDRRQWRHLTRIVDPRLARHRRHDPIGVRRRLLARPPTLRHRQCARHRSRPKPTIASGYPRSRVNLNLHAARQLGGFELPDLQCGTGRRRAIVSSASQARDSQPRQNSAVVGSLVKVTANGNCLVSPVNEDYAYLTMAGLGSAGSCASPSGSNFNN